jgi:hypothetical protein
VAARVGGESLGRAAAARTKAREPAGSLRVTNDALHRTCNVYYAARINGGVAPRKRTSIEL